MRECFVLLMIESVVITGHWFVQLAISLTGWDCFGLATCHVAGMHNLLIARPPFDCTIHARACSKPWNTLWTWVWSLVH